MSQDEQMLVMGRVVSEYGEIKKKLAALLAEGERHGGAFQNFAAYLKGSEYSESGLRHGQKPPDLSMLPTAQNLNVLIEETLATIVRKRELYAQLKAFGVEPKD